MKRAFFIFTILVVLLCTFIVIPSFKVDIAGKTFAWPEIDYSRLLGRNDNMGFSFEKGGDFTETTTVKMLVSSGSEDDAIKVSEIARQRLELMSAKDAEVSYFKEDENYFIKVSLFGVGSLVDKQAFAITSAEKIQILKEQEAVIDETTGESSVQEEPSFVPVALDYDLAKTANMKFNSSIGRYTIDVKFDESALTGVNETLLSPSAGAFLGQEPIAAIVTGGSSTVAKLEFAASSEVGRSEALVLLSLLGTKAYPVGVTESSRDVFVPQRTDRDLLVFAGVFALGYILVAAFFFFTHREISKFIAGALFMFTVLTLSLFKLPTFSVAISVPILLGFIIGFVSAIVIFFYSVQTVHNHTKSASAGSKEKLFNEIFSKISTDLRVFLIFILFILIVLNMIFSKIGSDIVAGFGYSVVTLLIMHVVFLKSLLWNLYISPIQINLKNVFRKNKG